MSKEVEAARRRVLMRREMESDINRLLSSIARNLRKALAKGNIQEIERIVTLLEKGLKPDD